MTFPPSTQAPEVMEPGEAALSLPSVLVPLELAPVLGLGPAAPAVRCDQLHPVLIGQPGVELARVVSLVANQADGEVLQEPPVERSFDQSCFMRASTSNPHV